jgi:hypothetical protein
MGSFRKRRWNSVTSLLELLGAGQEAAEPGPQVRAAFQIVFT